MKKHYLVLSDEWLHKFAEENNLKIKYVKLKDTSGFWGRWMVFMGYLFSLGLVISFLFVFFSAYLNPMKQIIVDINFYGEADFELILIFVVLVFIILGLVFSTGFLFSKKKQWGEFLRCHS